MFPHDNVHKFKGICMGVSSEETVSCSRCLKNLIPSALNQNQSLSYWFDHTIVYPILYISHTLESLFVI